jgi:Cu/Ag efflux protein CusF
MNRKQAARALAISIAFALTGGISRGGVDEPAAPEKPKAEVFAGTIRAVDTEKRVITVEATPLNKTFGVASDCEVTTKDKPRASLEDLKVGDVVHVTYEAANDMLVAHRIEQQGPPQETDRATAFVRYHLRYVLFQKSQ